MIIPGVRTSQQVKPHPPCTWCLFQPHPPLTQNSPLSATELSSCLARRHVTITHFCNHSLDVASPDCKWTSGWGSSSWVNLHTRWLNLDALATSFYANKHGKMDIWSSSYQHSLMGWCTKGSSGQDASTCCVSRCFICKKLFFPLQILRQIKIK